MAGPGGRGGPVRVLVTGALLLLEACRWGSVHVVAASSSSVYGAVPDLPKHEDLPTRPLSPYGASKLAGRHARRTRRSPDTGCRTCGRSKIKQTWSQRRDRVSARVGGVAA